MTIGIYKIINKKTGQMYIGKSINIERRFKEHIQGIGCPSSYIDNAIQKHGKDYFEFEIIEKLNENTPFLDDILNNREVYYINYYDTFKNNFHYNLTIGGDGVGFGENNPMYGKKHSEKTKKKLSKLNAGENNPNYGKKLSEETKKKISKANSGKNNPFFGKHHSEKAKKKMSKAKSGKNHPNYGKKRSEETKKKISKSISGENHPMYGKKLSEKTKKKMSEAQSGENHPMYGKKHTEKTKKKMSESHIKKYARIIKDGKKNNKQIYAIKYQGKRIKTSFSIDKLYKWFFKNHPLEIIKTYEVR